MAAAAESLHRALTGADLEGGLSHTQATEAFGRILSSPSISRVVVSTRDFPPLVRQSQSFQLVGVGGPRSAPRLHPRPELPCAYAAPADDTERLIAEVWQEELGIERIGVHDDFFSAGGDSLIAIRLVSRLRQLLDAPLGVRSLYDRPTVAALASQVRAIRWASEAAGSDSPDAIEGVL
jgi:hypothetical protein